MIHRYIIEATDEVKGFDEAIEKLDREWGIEELKWIPVEEELPPTHEAVLLYVENSKGWRTYALGMWNDARNGWEDWLSVDLLEKDLGYKVLAWMELPEEYKPE